MAIHGIKLLDTRISILGYNLPVLQAVNAERKRRTLKIISHTYLELKNCLSLGNVRGSKRTSESLINRICLRINFYFLYFERLYEID